MVTANQARTMLEPHGFVHHEAPGFIGFHRTHTDGRKQLLHLFSWSNPKHADAQGIPHSYVVIAPMIDASTLPGESGFHVQEDGRFTVIVKGFGGHPVRTWAEVSDEIIERILPALDLPEPTGRALLTRLHETNHLPPKKEDAMKNLDWDPCIVDPQKPAAPHLIPIEERERLHASWLANLRPHRPEDMLSDGDRSDVVDLMVAQPGVLHGRLRHHPRQTSDASREDI